MEVILYTDSSYSMVFLGDQEEYMTMQTLNKSCHAVILNIMINYIIIMVGSIKIHKISSALIG